MFHESRPAGCTRPCAGSSPRLLSADSLRFAVLAAKHSHPVLIVGETGSGKTHLARIIHESGPRAGEPFVRVNCAAVPESLFERELFGHVRGAFTGAQESSAGFLEAAHRGTLFLDEIGELPLPLQAKLLTVMDDAAFRRLGSTREIPMDLRVIVATNRDLPAMVRAGGYRQDLYYRCSAFQHRVPPLRDRMHNFDELVDELLARNTPTGAPPVRANHRVLARLRAHDWPGNVRELENVLRYALVTADEGAMEAHHLPDPLSTSVTTAGAPACDGAAAASRYQAPPSEGEEVELIRRALGLEGGNRTRAARRLGMSRSALWMKLRIYSKQLDHVSDAACEESAAVPPLHIGRVPQPQTFTIS
jgi:transcriptional regulator with PAS, ATPase and Fis domain